MFLFMLTIFHWFQINLNYIIKVDAYAVLTPETFPCFHYVINNYDVIIPSYWQSGRTSPRASPPDVLYATEKRNALKLSLCISMLVLFREEMKRVSSFESNCFFLWLAQSVATWGRFIEMAFLFQVISDVDSILYYLFVFLIVKPNSQLPHRGRNCLRGKTISYQFFFLSGIPLACSSQILKF